MRLPTLRLLGLSLACLLATPATVPATDVDGPNDCTRTPSDWGDAPEGVDAYPGVTGRFPTCFMPTPAGTWDVVPGCPAISTAPGVTGFVRHTHTLNSYWLGCPPAGGAPQGLDSDQDGKMNAVGLGVSACEPAVAVDCAESAFTMTFGQDECYGSTDAGIAAALSFGTCTVSNFSYSAYNCGSTRQVYLNVLVDMNADGDWNDNFQCPGPTTLCAYEWAVKNVLIGLAPGCNALTTPGFLTGPNAGPGWLRITLSNEPVTDDFPWAGVAVTNQSLHEGETEDYPVNLQGPCPPYDDFGDAPEGVSAYPSGVIGCFPTCGANTGPGTQTLAPGCPAISTPPGMTGFVKHVSVAADPFAYWLGCGTPGVDGEPDGKMNATGGAFSSCLATLAVDCTQAAFGVMTFGQDDCCTDVVDHGVDPCDLKFTACENSTVGFYTFNCKNETQAYLNILIDMNEDGDWNDNFLCPGPTTLCAYEWAVKNKVIPIPVGCVYHVTDPILIGPNGGHSWMRVTISSDPVDDTFPWNGSQGPGGTGYLHAGETEDYPIEISGHCPEYNDWGDAPENGQAYIGVPGHFPTCSTPTAAGDLDLAPNCPPISTPPGPTGYVCHLTTAADPFAFWLGCGTPGVDGEPDGKFNDNGGPVSNCLTTLAVDCFETNFGLTFGQDECYGDGVDAGLDLPKLGFTVCQRETLAFKAFNCKTERDVYLNILVDMNQDGDWNDNFQCPTVCAYEWAVKNYVITLAPGCNTLYAPPFWMGPNAGNGWLRITLTTTPVSDAFPWDGSAGGPGGQGFFSGGETEDYPVVINGTCDIGYRDFGDAPEELMAYTSGLSGHFPTCIFGSGPGTQEIDCGVALSTPPGITGYVMHEALPTDADKFWFGCPEGAIDGEMDGKMNIIPPFGPSSACNSAVLVDCSEALGPLVYGQDECYGDADAGLGSFQEFGRCSTQAVTFRAYNCTDHNLTANLNILVDWNQDADWNDNTLCFQGKICAPEWAVKNQTVTLVPGCNIITSQPIQVGPREGDAWMRMSLSSDPAPNDFPWNGSVSNPGSAMKGGETEDYPVRITPSLVAVPDGRAPGGLWLAPIVPNPAMNGVLLRYSLPREERVSLAAYDLAGRKLMQLVSERKPAGEHSVNWNFRDAKGAPISAGYYVVKLRVGDRVMMQRGIRIR